VAETADVKSDLGANAAMKYWEGFALLPTLDQDQERILEEWNKVPLDAAAIKLIERSEMSRVYLHRGVKLARCDWSLDYEDGIRLLLPHLSKSLTLARLTALHARREFEQGHWQAGWDDITALLKLGRHVELTPIMIGNLVGYRIESIAIDAAAPWLPELKAVVTADALAVLDALPSRATLQQLVLTEKQIGPVWLIGELQRAEQRQAGAWQAVWSELLLGPGEGSDNTLRELAQSVKTIAQAVKMLEEHIPFYDQLAKISALPRNEFDVRYPEFVAKTKASSRLAGFLLAPNMEKFVAAQRRGQAQFALFQAALAVVQGGPEKLKGISDPFGDGPFEYRLEGNGFELKSKFVFKDHAVTLTAGRSANRR
jgi:hypothetical protein